jgi:hypothetical protein
MTMNDARTRLRGRENVHKRYLVHVPVVMEMLHQLDRRLRLVELCLSARRARLLPAVPSDDEEGPQQRRPRGRPKGAANLPRLEVGRPLFDENELDAGELIAMRVVEGWLRGSKARRRPAHLWAPDDDEAA